MTYLFKTPFSKKKKWKGKTFIKSKKKQVKKQSESSGTAKSKKTKDFKEEVFFKEQERIY